MSVVVILLRTSLTVSFCPFSVWVEKVSLAVCFCSSVSLDSLLASLLEVQHLRRQRLSEHPNLHYLVQEHQGLHCLSHLHFFVVLVASVLEAVDFFVASVDVTCFMTFMA